MNDRGRSHLLWLVIALVTLAIGSWLTLRLAFPSFIPPPLPQPNGYDDLLRAAEMLAPRTGFYDEMEPEELAAIVEHNRPALALVREALDKECGVPVDWSHNPASIEDPTIENRSLALRALSRAFAADMREKLANRQTNAAVASGLATFRLGKKCYRGGLIIDHLVGIAVQSVAINELRQVVAQDQAARVEILRRLVPLLDTGEPPEVVIQRDIADMRTYSGGIEGWIIGFNSQQLLKLMEPSVQAARQATLRNTAQQLLFVIHLALHAYQDEHGAWPDTLAKLAPEILASIPVDPYSKVPFIYRVEIGAYRLYSVGRNLVDDGGEVDETGLGTDMTYDLTTEDEAQ